MKRPSFILANHAAKMYTHLNEYIPKKNTFRGEYSILHNQYADDAYFLSRFLHQHPNQEFYLLTNEDEKYNEIIHDYQRFFEADISKYIEEKVQKENESNREIDFDKNLGQLQLSILKGLVEKQLEDTRNTNASNAAEHQVFLGKELSLQWVLHTIEDIIERGR